MDIKRQFEYNPSIEVNASQIGIGRWNWITINRNDVSKAGEIMKANRFDVLPIENHENKVTSYYSTQIWNDYTQINRSNIKDAQQVYYKLSLKDLVRKFNLEERHYYFLTDYDQILGLVSYVNLNCQLVYNYLFYIISDLEREISKLLKENIAQEEIIERFKKSRDSQLNSLAHTFQTISDSNNDNDIFQHMYLSNLGPTLVKFKNQIPEEFQKLENYSSKLDKNGVFNIIRNKVMHPVRPILSDRKSIAQIDELLTDYMDIKNILNTRV